MTSGAALTYVQPETASQIVCQLLDRNQWERLLGGQVGREPLDYPRAGCQIATERGRFTVQLRESEDAFEATTTIAGRPATTYDRSQSDVAYVVALTDDALGAAPPARHRTLRTLEVAAERDVAMAVLTEIVPLLVKEGEPLPAIDDGGQIAYVPTYVTRDGQFIDLPLPVQALQLCTAVLEKPDPRLVATEVHVADTGTCTLTTNQGRVSLEVKHSAIDSYRDTIAGRPANVEPPVVTVRLRDDAEAELYVSAPDSVALAEKLVSLLVG